MVVVTFADTVTLDGCKLANHGRKNRYRVSKVKQNRIGAHNFHAFCDIHQNRCSAKGQKSSGIGYSVRTDETVDFAWRNQMPDPYTDSVQYSIRWTGNLCPAVSGTHLLKLTYSGCAPCEIPRILIDGTEIGTQAAVHLEAGREYPITVEYVKSAEDPSVRLMWVVPAANNEDPFAAECEAAKNADAVIAVVGLGTEYEMEGRDKDTLDLPPEQTELLNRLFAVSSNVIVVVVSGSPLTIPDIHARAAAVIEAWYPGEAGGSALADLLYGNINPSGRLCATFPYSVRDIPAFDDYEMEHGRTYMYEKKDPLYPFGFGLSYTTYAYSALSVDGRTVSLNVSNVGARDGEEVVQLYLDSAQETDQPKLRLVRFARIALAAGETKNVTFTLDDRSFTLFDRDGKEYIAQGTYTLYAGGALPTERSAALGAAAPVCAVIKP